MKDAFVRLMLFVIVRKHLVQTDFLFRNGAHFRHRKKPEMTLLLNPFHCSKSVSNVQQGQPPGAVVFYMGNFRWNLKAVLKMYYKNIGVIEKI